MAKSTQKSTVKKKKTFKDFYEQGTLGVIGRNVGDFSHCAEAEYADGQDNLTPAVQPVEETPPDNPTKHFKIGEVRLDNPYGTGPKHFKGIDRIPGTSKEDALQKFVGILINRENIKNGSRGLIYNQIVQNGVTIDELPVTPVPRQTYWWEKD